MILSKFSFLASVFALAALAAGGAHAEGRMDANLMEVSSVNPKLLGGADNTFGYSPIYVQQWDKDFAGSWSEHPAIRCDKAFKVAIEIKSDAGDTEMDGVINCKNQIFGQSLKSLRDGKAVVGILSGAKLQAWDGLNSPRIMVSVQPLSTYVEVIDSRSGDKVQVPDVHSYAVAFSMGTNQPETSYFKSNALHWTKVIVKSVDLTNAAR